MTTDLEFHLCDQCGNEIDPNSFTIWINDDHTWTLCDHCIESNNREDN